MTEALAPVIVALRDWAVAMGAFAASIVALATALRLPQIGRPLRYVAHYLIVHPLQIALRPIIHEAIDSSPAVVAVRLELERNDGSSIKDAVDRIERRLELGDHAMGALREQLAEDGRRLDLQCDTLRQQSAMLARLTGAVD